MSNNFPELKDPDCIDCTPSKLDSTKVPPKYRDFARALLLSLGIDPSPNNVSKLVYKGEFFGGVHIQVGSIKTDSIDKELVEYIIYNEDTIVNVLEHILLTRPLALPSRLLAVLLTHAVNPNLVEIDYRHVIQIAENFRQNPTHESIFTLRAMIDLDPFLEEHLNEILIMDFEGKQQALKSISQVFNFNNAKEQIYKDKFFYIFEFDSMNNPIDLTNDHQDYYGCCIDECDIINKIRYDNCIENTKEQDIVNESCKSQRCN